MQKHLAVGSDGIGRAVGVGSSSSCVKLFLDSWNRDTQSVPLSVLVFLEQLLD